MTQLNSALRRCLGDSLPHDRGACFGALLICLQGHAARADVVVADWSDDEHFEYQVSYMPDLDQKRNGLIGNGDSFCVPTATLNLLSYAAEWGVEDMEPGPGVWNGAVSYNTMTNQLDDLGDLMFTTINCSGTCLSDWHNALEEWMDGSPLVATSFVYTEEDCPTASDLVQMATNGALVSFAYGRYEFNPSDMPVIGTRTGGHAVTMAYAHADGSDDLELWSCDPADDDPVNLNSQSPWAFRIYDPVETMLVQADFDNDSLYHPVEVTTLEYDPEGDKIRFIDYVLAICPLQGFGFDTVELNVDFIGGFDFTAGTPTTHFEPPAGELFLDAELHPDLHSFMILSQGPPNGPASVAQLSRLTGEITPIMAIESATEMVVGRNRDLYIASGFVLRRLSEQAGEWSEIDSLAWPPTWNFQDIGWNDNIDEVIALSVSDKKLVVAPPNLGSEVDPVFVYEVPSFIPFADEACMAINPADNSIWFTLPGIDSGFVRRLQISGPELLHSTLSHPALVNPTCVDFDDRGHMLVVLADGAVRDFEPNSAGGWTLVRGGWYANLQVQPNFKVARSRTNYDSDLHDDVDVYIPTAELPEIGEIAYQCPGDFDGDLVVGPGDLAQLLALWGPCPSLCAADLTNDGNVGPADLANLLAKWGSCLPIDPV